MKFDWNEDTIRRYQEANEYTGFFKNIADLIKPRLSPYSSLCDIGCGLGLVDLELCKSIKNITCIDISKEAINALKQNIEERKITNIDAQLMNCDSITDNWDVIYISFFGSRNIEKFLPHCKKLFAVVNTNNSHGITLEKYKTFHKNTVANVEEALNLKGIHYSLTNASFEFGQPFVSLEDARQFIKIISPGITSEDLGSFLSNQLIKTNEEKYPFFLPNLKPIGLFEIDGEL